jgi:hypothetical protein
MKILIVLLTILFFDVSSGQAEEPRYYIVDQNNKVVAMCNYVPNFEVLDSRGQTAVEQAEFIPLEEARYIGKKIVWHVPTQQELNEDKEEYKQSLEYSLVSLQNEIVAAESLFNSGKPWAKGAQKRLEAEQRRLETEYQDLISE